MYMLVKMEWWWSIAQPLTENTILATFDVTSLYTNILNTHGFAAVNEFLQSRPKEDNPKNSIHVLLTKFILEKNHF